MNQKLIAEKAGVSTATVSNVINGNFHKVSQETVAKVRQVIEQEGYAVNAMAKSLASNKSRIIGVVLPNLGEDQAFSVNPYNSYILGYLERYIRNQGYYMMLRCVGKCREVIPLFSSWNVDGVICLGPGEGEAEEISSSYNVPMVFIDAYSTDEKIVNVAIDDRRGGYLASKYLLERGHRKLAFIGPKGPSSVVQERYQGFLEACREFGVEQRPEDYFESYTIFEHGVAAGVTMARSGRGYTAAVVTADLVAFGVMEGLRQCGLSVPGDVSLIGFDDLPECAFTTPKLTTLSQNLPEKARLAGERLFALINGDQPGPIPGLAPSVTVRESVQDLTRA